MFDKVWFEKLESQIRSIGADSDAQTFDEIRENLVHPKKLSPDDFAYMCAYVILAGGFSQKTAKKIHANVCEFLRSRGADADGLLSVFNNKNKINAICKIWNNRKAVCAGYYRIDNLDGKLKYLGSLPHIGKITANHLARNLGENVVKYDIWIQRLGVVFASQKQSSKCKVQSSDIDNGNLHPEIKSACDDMFEYLHNETGLPIGYIDVVLWKALQIGLIKL